MRVMWPEQIFTEPESCARHCARHDKHSTVPVLMALAVLLGRQTLNKLCPPSLMELVMEKLQHRVRTSAKRLGRSSFRSGMKLSLEGWIGAIEIGKGG